MVRRHELTDAQWAKIDHAPPGRAGDPGRTGVDNRLFVNAVLFVLKTGTVSRASAATSFFTFMPGVSRERNR